MRNTILLLSLLVSFIDLNAQAWTDVGLKLGGGVSYLYNSNIESNNIYNPKPFKSGSYNIGAKAGINIGEHHSINGEVMFSSMKKLFVYKTGLGELDFDNEIKWTNIDLYLLYRHYREGSFLEIGVMRSNVRKVEQTDVPAGLLNEVDVSNFYESGYWSGVLGTGTFIAGSDRFTVMLGIRMHVGLTDFVSEAGHNNIDPFPNSNVSGSTAIERVNTLPILVEFMSEFNFGLGFFAKTVCSGRVKWFGS